MEFRQVVLACLDFSIANKGTIQSYPAGQPDRLQLESRTTRTTIFVERDPVVLGHWRVQQREDAVGGRDQLSSATVSSVEDLLAFLESVWH